jgi:hypothetical protein
MGPARVAIAVLHVWQGGGLLLRADARSSLLAGMLLHFLFRSIVASLSILDALDLSPLAYVPSDM